MSTYSTIGSSNSSSSGTSVTFTTGVAVNVGDLVVVRYACEATARPAGLTCTENTAGGTNTFAIAIDGSNGVDSYAAIFWCVATSAMAIGKVITVATTASFNFIGIDAIKSTNPSSSTPLDATPTKVNFGTSTAATSGATASPSTSDWVGVCVIYYAASSVNQQAGWTEDVDNGSVGFETQTIIGTNTTAMQGAGTLLSSGVWICAVAVFKLGVAASARGRQIGPRQAVMRGATR